MTDETGPPRSSSMVRTAAAFYGAMVVAAFVWAGLDGRLPLWFGPPPTLDSALRWSLVGALFGLCIIILSHLLMRFSFAQDLARLLSAMLGPLRWSEAFMLALLSGVGEELLFRGAIQPNLGLAGTTLVFALVHWPVVRALVPWTISAGLIGLGFGLAFELSGHVIGPVVAHFTINFVNLKILSHFADR